MATRHVPLRTCVGCRQRSAAPELVRLVLRQGRVTATAGPSDGRGAWVHPSEACVTAAVKARAFGRAFRAAVEVPSPAELFAAASAAGFSQ